MEQLRTSTKSGDFFLWCGQGKAKDSFLASLITVKQQFFIPGKAVLITGAVKVKKILGVVGSYRKQGNTELFTKLALVEAEKYGRKTEMIRLTDFKF